MKLNFVLSNYITEIQLLMENSLPSEQLTSFVNESFPYLHRAGLLTKADKLRFNQTVIQASSEPWSQVIYQSLYLDDMGDPADRIILQEPSTTEPMVCVTVLKSARLSGMTGFVFCGTKSAIESFKSKLPEYEQLGVDLDNAKLLECLKEAAEKEHGLKIIYSQVGAEDELDLEV